MNNNPEHNDGTVQPVRCSAWLGDLRRYITQMAPHHRGRTGGRLLLKAADEIERLRAIIARNALQRLRGEDAAELYVTADDIKDSLEVLYAWQASKPPNDQAQRRAWAETTQQLKPNPNES